jgi:hypothetical protein
MIVAMQDENFRPVNSRFVTVGSNHGQHQEMSIIKKVKVKKTHCIYGLNDDTN